MRAESRLDATLAMTDDDAAMPVSPNRIAVLGGAGDDLSRALVLLRDAGYQVAHYESAVPIIAIETSGAKERRARTHSVSDEIVVGEFALEQTARILHFGTRSVVLAPREFRVMRALMRAPQRALTRHQLCNDAEIRTAKASGRRRSLDMQILQLRKFIEPDMSQPQHILTVRQVGYRFEPVASPALAQLYRRRITRPA
jgi:DNA-binding response OmpR family regulator